MTGFVWSVLQDSTSSAGLLEIIEDRHGKCSTIISSQLPVSAWRKVIGEQTIADAILDRMVHNSLRIELKGESLRKKKAESSEAYLDQSFNRFHPYLNPFDSKITPSERIFSSLNPSIRLPNE